MYQYYFSNHFENPFWSVVKLPEKFSGRTTDHQIILTFELNRSILDFGLTNKESMKNENASLSPIQKSYQMKDTIYLLWQIWL